MTIHAHQTHNVGITRIVLMEFVWVYVKMRMIAYEANCAMVSGMNKQFANDM